MIPAERAFCFSSFNVGIFFQKGKKIIFFIFLPASRGDKGILAEIPQRPLLKTKGEFCGIFSKFCLIAYRRKCGFFVLKLAGKVVLDRIRKMGFWVSDFVSVSLSRKN